MAICVGYREGFFDVIVCFNVARVVFVASRSPFFCSRVVALARSMFWLLRSCGGSWFEPVLALHLANEE